MITYSHNDSKLFILSLIILIFSFILSTLCYSSYIQKCYVNRFPNHNWEGKKAPLKQLDHVWNK